MILDREFLAEMSGVLTSALETLESDQVASASSPMTRLGERGQIARSIRGGIVEHRIACSTVESDA